MSESARSAPFAGLVILVPCSPGLTPRALCCRALRALSDTVPLRGLQKRSKKRKPDIGRVASWFTDTTAETLCEDSQASADRCKRYKSHPDDLPGSSGGRPRLHGKYRAPR